MHLFTVRRLLLGLAACLVFAGGLRAREPFRYPEKKYGKGELKYINNLPVLTVEGTPEEIGEQVGMLGSLPAIRLLDYPNDVLHDLLKRQVPAFAYEKMCETTMKFFLTNGESMVKAFPADYRTEMDAMVRTARIDRAKAVLGNTMFDAKNLVFTFHKPFGCAALMIEPGRSSTGAPLFGRLLDFPTAGYLNEYSLVTVYRPTGKHAFVSIGFPGLIGCLSGMNDAGLTLAVLESYDARDDSPKFDPKGTPYALCFRRVLEECTTVEEAEKLLRGMHRCTLNNLAICDRHHSAVFEITPRSVCVRSAREQVCCCTNHFRTEELCTSTKCWRFDILSECREMEKVDLSAIARKLNAVNQGRLTIQAMIFEPATLKLHLAIGTCPASALPMKELDLAALLKR